MDVSIIVVNWNTRDSLCNCLESIRSQAGDIDYEIIVIDNASIDNSVEMLRSRFPWITLISNSENRGFAAANNQGMRLAKGRYVLLLNPDTIVCDKAIEKTINYADNHPDVAVVGCQVWENPELVQMTCFRFPNLVNTFLSTFWLSKVFKNNKIFGREWMLWWKRDTERDVDVMSGMFMLVPRTAIDDVGLMDEAFFIYAEEADWCYRFTKNGWKVRFWPGAKIIHVHGGSHSSSQAAVAMFVQEQKSLLIFLKKHTGILHCWLARVTLIVSFAFRVFAYGLVFPVTKFLDRDVKYFKQRLARSWAAFKFLAFGLQPESIKRKGGLLCPTK